MGFNRAPSPKSDGLKSRPLHDIEAVIARRRQSLPPEIRRRILRGLIGRIDDKDLFSPGLILAEGSRNNSEIQRVMDYPNS
jgi:hypothetical protein